MSVFTGKPGKPISPMSILTGKPGKPISPYVATNWEAWQAYFSLCRYLLGSLANLFLLCRSILGNPFLLTSVLTGKPCNPISPMSIFTRKPGKPISLYVATYWEAWQAYFSLCQYLLGSLASLFLP